MTTSNIWQQFKALIPEGMKTIAKVSGHNGNGSSQVELSDGSTIMVKGESGNVGEKVLIKKGEIQSVVPELPHYEADV